MISSNRDIDRNFWNGISAGPIHSKLRTFLYSLGYQTQDLCFSVMAQSQKSKPASLLSPQFINGVYIPSGLLIFGVGIVKLEWLPFAVAVSLVLGAWKIYSTGQLFLGHLNAGR